MILIFGGAYNGKKEYVKENFNVSDKDILNCKDEKIFSLISNEKVINGFHIFIRECIKKDIDALDLVLHNIEKLKDKIIISDETNSGVVPIKAKERLYREILGKVLQYLSKKSNIVIRVFFGLEEVLKHNVSITLIRHGKTYCNEKSLYCGKSDVSISKIGEEELLKKKHYFNKKYDYYFTSGLKRTEDTFKIYFGNILHEKNPLLKEYNFGLYELKSYYDMEKDKHFIKWLYDETDDIKCPEGESRREFKERIKKGFNILLEKACKEKICTMAGVLHGGSIGMILELLYDNKKKFYNWQPENGEGYIIKADVLKNKIIKADLISDKKG
ncbi:bifunctional adenosylcobinamide kinase/adenosylcobinamide-phosphate guanylyltransferase [Clostridium sp. BJN0001]|uniref:bifunctional adenosylcobinamide kinase/adenosylcobinamide-phosphate guanylyltransferase n=1 Tax=Clostridium sp. BJN0001 TaxID=2930219 RepID=UPI001FD47B11|nr:bifunctional adenosylcobinamide kinase/adenosylcobinamide-phosphate guanylyltransferase [Clostridium sp. BJN0001]